MKILIYGMTETFGGVEKFLIDRIPYLIEAGHQVDVSFSTQNKINYLETLKRLSIGIKYVAKLSQPICYYKTIKRLIEKEKYDIVYCNVGFSNILLYKAVKNAGAKLVVHSHNTQIDCQSGFKRNLLTLYHYVSRLLAGNIYDRRLACSKLAGKWLYAHHSEHFTVIHNAIHMGKYLFDAVTRERIRKTLNLNGQFVIGNIGRFSFQKNQEFLIDVFCEILRVRKNSILLLIGDGEKREILKNKAIKLNCIDKIRFLGFRKDVNVLLQGMDCFVLPSRFEGLGIAGIEAQAASLPSLFSDKVTNEVNITPLAEFLSIRQSPKVWAQKICEMAPCQRKNMEDSITRAGYNIIKEKTRFLQVFERLS